MLLQSKVWKRKFYGSTLYFQSFNHYQWNILMFKPFQCLLWLWYYTWKPLTLKFWDVVIGATIYIMGSKGVQVPKFEPCLWHSLSKISCES